LPERLVPAAAAFLFDAVVQCFLGRPLAADFEGQAFQEAGFVRIGAHASFLWLIAFMGWLSMK
jgi:hypothetical protein